MEEQNYGFRCVDVDVITAVITQETQWGGESEFIAQCGVAFLSIKVDVSIRRDWWLIKNGGYLKRGKSLTCNKKAKSESALAKKASWWTRCSNIDLIPHQCDSGTTDSVKLRQTDSCTQLCLPAEAKLSFSLFSVLSVYVSLPSKSISSALTLIKEHIPEQ